jgi:uncharacterized protein YyaL (SSP411 family)
MLKEDGSLLRRFRDGDAAIPGMLEDYAFLIQGLLDLYESTFAFEYLAAAIAIAEKQSLLLEDEAGGFFTSMHEDASSLIRMKDDYDGAEPSGNSVALMNLVRLHRITGRGEFESSARRLVAVFGRGLANAPFGMPQMLAACEFDIAPPREIVVAGHPDGGMMRVLWEGFDPNRVLLYAAPQLVQYQPAMADMKGDAVYLCENFACQEPAVNEDKLLQLLK